ncbi:unnamed protein product [Soboliphyme baturini]|uniref:NTF2 domain-containing protein n=1 Tax=Soboliphyme baturini TaxID=241478 RepID=A0A183J216_9BILA|nr:unnamed protein product [Soboliphyme baturini]
MELFSLQFNSSPVEIHSCVPDEFDPSILGYYYTTKELPNEGRVHGINPAVVEIIRDKLQTEPTRRFLDCAICQPSTLSPQHEEQELQRGKGTFELCWNSGPKATASLRVKGQQLHIHIGSMDLIGNAE